MHRLVVVLLTAKSLWFAIWQVAAPCITPTKWFSLPQITRMPPFFLPTVGQRRAGGGNSTHGGQQTLHLRFSASVSQDGRAPSGVLVCAMFCFCHLFNNPIPAMQLLSAKRPGSGLWPSHRRCVCMQRRARFVRKKKKKGQRLHVAGVWLSLPPGAPFNTSCVAFVVWFIYRPVKLPEHWEENDISVWQKWRGRKGQRMVRVTSRP